MPRVNINRKQYKVDDFGSWLIGRLHKAKKTEQMLADELDITRQAVSYKIKHCSFSYSDLITVFEFLQITDEEILQVMKL